MIELNEAFSHVAVGYVDSSDAELAKQVAQKWRLQYIGHVASLDKHPKLTFLLQVNFQVLELVKIDEPKLSAIKVDFVEGAAAHRRKFGGGRGQDIAKAVGLKHGFTPHVLDATAGLGRDSFVLASLGCQVTMIERMPIVAALLENGLERARLSTEVSDIISNMELVHTSLTEDSFDTLMPDVVYLDPMYPHREKSAAVKKEMRVFQTLVGEDLDADALLAPALAIAKYRVVVKRPTYAPPLANKKPSTSIKMKKNRFDVYVIQGIPKLDKEK
ncbi:class I SAM-dependent methyltransferase [Pseudocolwellia sp. HL-MZ7]|uniref:class I SAM-dependent methyltransferase n=1 Tax=Pseudocolwellia sp. HL-MZ7 TaxID=3400627 RepID=UPI003CFA0EFC